MSKIPHDALFAFGDYKRDLKEIKELSIEFGKSLTEVISRLGKDQDQLKTKFADLAATLKGFNIAQPGADQGINRLITQVDILTDSMNGLKKTEKTLNDVQAENAKRLSELSATYQKLLAEYHTLDPAEKNSVQRKKEINNEIKLIIPGLRAYGQVLKTTKQTIDATEGSYKAMQAQLSALNSKLRNLPGAFDAVTGKINKQNKEAVQLQAQITKLTGVLKTADAQMGVFYRNVGNYSSALGGVGRNIGSLAAQFLTVYGAINLLNKSIDVSSRFQALNVAIGVVSNSSEELSINQQFLASLAEKYGQDIFVLTNAYKGLAAASRETSLEGSKTRDIFEAIIAKGNSLKLTNDQIEGSLLAVQQMMSKGTVQSEELRGQLGERLPGAFALFAKGLNVSTAELGKMLQAGQVLASEALPKFAAELQKSIGPQTAESMHALVNETNRLSNAFNRFLDSGKVTKFFTVLESGLARFVDDLNYTINTGAWKTFFLDANKLTEERIAAEKKAADALNVIRGFEAQSAEERTKRIAAAEVNQFVQEQNLFKLRTQLNDAVLKQDQKQIEAINAKIKILKDAIAQQNDVLAKFKAIDATQSAAEDAAKNGKKTKTPAELAAEAQALAAFKKRIQDQENALKAGYELDVAEAELAVAKKEITESGFQELKLKLSEKYVEAAIKKELELGKNADQAKIIEFKKFLVEAQKAKIQLDNKLALNPAATRRQETDQAAFTRGQNAKPGTSAVGDAVEPGIKASAKQIADEYDIKIKGEQEAFDILTAGHDASYKQEQDHLERIRVLNEEAAKKIGIKDIELSEKYSNEAGEKKVAAARLSAEKMKEIEVMTAEFIGQVLSAAVQIERDQFNAASEARIDKLEEEKQREIDFSGYSAAQKDAIERKLNDQIKKEKVKAAKHDKSLALTQIEIDTAVAVAKTLATLGVPAGLIAAAFAAAAGAAQYLIVKKQPIPQFKKGTENAPTGLAIVNEAGPELIQERSGRMRIAEGFLTNLQGGEKIFTHDASKKLIEDSIKYQEMNDILRTTTLQAQMAKDIRIGAQEARIKEMALALQSGGLNSATLTEAFEAAIKKIPIQQNIYDERGYLKRIQEVNERRTYLNSR